MVVATHRESGASSARNCRGISPSCGNRGASTGRVGTECGKTGHRGVHRLWRRKTASTSIQPWLFPSARIVPGVPACSPLHVEERVVVGKNTTDGFQPFESAHDVHAVIPATITAPPRLSMMRSGSASLTCRDARASRRSMRQSTFMFYQRPDVASVREIRAARSSSDTRASTSSSSSAFIVWFMTHSAARTRVE